MRPPDTAPARKPALLPARGRAIASGDTPRGPGRGRRGADDSDSGLEDAPRGATRCLGSGGGPCRSRLRAETPLRRVPCSDGREGQGWSSPPGLFPPNEQTLPLAPRRAVVPYLCSRRAVPGRLPSPRQWPLGSPEPREGPRREAQAGMCDPRARSLCFPRTSTKPEPGALLGGPAPWPHAALPEEFLSPLLRLPAWLHIQLAASNNHYSPCPCSLPKVGTAYFHSNGDVEAQRAYFTYSIIHSRNVSRVQDLDKAVVLTSLQVSARKEVVVCGNCAIPAHPDKYQEIPKPGIYTHPFSCISTHMGHGHMLSMFTPSGSQVHKPSIFLLKKKKTPFFAWTPTYPSTLKWESPLGSFP